VAHHLTSCPPAGRCEPMPRESTDEYGLDTNTLSLPGVALQDGGGWSSSRSRAPSSFPMPIAHYLLQQAGSKDCVAYATTGTCPVSGTEAGRRLCRRSKLAATGKSRYGLKPNRAVPIRRLNDRHYLVPTTEPRREGRSCQQLPGT
jgi:hypothetical protein